MAGENALTVAPETATIVRPASFVLADVAVRSDVAGLDEALRLAAERGRGSTDLADITAAVRSMYKAVGLDPTKVRPSSEALVRRVRRGEPLPRINTAVDVVNWCSMESQLPFGLYDATRIEGEIVLRLGRDGEAYPGIRKDVVHVAGRLTVADDAGPFGNPTSDSARTMVTCATTCLFVVIYAPPTVPVAHVDRVVATTRERLQCYCGPRTLEG
ncbi:MAG: phenylalanine--tRNA ligase beta subunit-related protein [Acidobacteriota bacterium]